MKKTYCYCGSEPTQNVKYTDHTGADDAPLCDWCVGMLRREGALIESIDPLTEAQVERLDILRAERRA